MTRVSRGDLGPGLARNGRRAARADSEGEELDRLLAMLKDPSPANRDQAACRLGELEDPRAATSLAAALEDEAHEVRWSAAGALLKLRDPRARDFYLEAIRGASTADRWAAVWALGNALKRGDRRALGPLREALNDASPEVNAAARDLLGAEQF